MIKYMNMGNIFKSLLVLLFLLTLLAISIWLICRCIIRQRSGTLKKGIVIRTVLCTLVAILCVIAFGDYVYPFERTLKPVPHGVAILPEDQVLEYPGQKHWRGAYEQFGLYAGSFYFDAESFPSQVYGVDLPPMDFKRYSYIITFGQEIEKLTYNVWDTIDRPVRTGAKVGHMVLDDEFNPEMIYIYRIPKIRIENDRQPRNDEVSAVPSNTQSSTETVFPKYEEGTFFNKNWADPIGTYKGDAVPDKETALEIAQAVFNGMGKSNGEKQLVPGSIFYDEEDEIWIVTFSPVSDQLPDGVLIVGGGCSIAIQKSDGKILRIWYGE